MFEPGSVVSKEFLSSFVTIAGAGCPILAPPGRDRCSNRRSLETLRGPPLILREFTAHTSLFRPILLM